MRSVAIMQPYFFPYLGYFQLLRACDIFVFYDDVNYIKQGWVNRNRILVGGSPLMFSVPLRDQSSHRRICDTGIDPGAYERWRRRFSRTVEQAYRRAPHFEAVYDVLRGVLDGQPLNIGDLARHSVLAAMRYVGLGREVVESSRRYDNAGLEGQARVLDICRREGATRYVNPPGGRDLYSAAEFAGHGIELRFLVPEPVEYAQTGRGFVPWLSIIDVLMFNTIEQCQSLLDRYTLEPG